MALTFSEKRALQKAIATNLAGLQAGNLSFAEKRRFQKEIQDAFVKLKEVVGIVSPEPASAADKPATKMSRVEWEEAVIRAIENKGEMTTSDAQGLLDGQTFAVAQAWGMGLEPGAAAEHIINAATVPPIPVAGKEAEPQNQKLADLIAGKHNAEPPEKFLGILQEIVEEINDVEPVKPPTIDYIEANKDKVDAIMESALAEVFGKLWDKTKGFPPLASTPVATPTVNDAVRIKPQEGDYGPPKKISIDIDDDFYGPTSFRAVIRAIEEARAGDTIEIKVNSNGGDTHSAQAIYVALLKTLAKTKAIIINTYSAGSIVAMSCDEIEPTPFCTMMIHNASTWSGGKLGDLAGRAGFLNDYFGEWFRQLYAGFLTEDELKDIIKGQDFWLKEPQIRDRLKNWKPIRKRIQEDGTVKAA